MINRVTIEETKAAKAPAATMKAITTPLLCFLPLISGFTADNIRNQSLSKEIKQLSHYLVCDNQAALDITSNRWYFMRRLSTLRCWYFVREKMPSRDIVTKLVKSSDEFANICSKFLTDPHINYILTNSDV